MTLTKLSAAPENRPATGESLDHRHAANFTL
jgi:hypothetical protein